MQIDPEGTMDSVDKEMNSFFLAKNSFVFGHPESQRDFTNHNGNTQKGVTISHTNKGSTPIKSGEIFRTESGKFSFLCTTCGSVWENCDGIVAHINSHFKRKKQNMENSETPFASPEFVSIDEVKTEPGLETKTVYHRENIAKDRSKLAIAPAVPKTTPKWLSSIANSKLQIVRTVKRANDLNIAAPEFLPLDKVKIEPDLDMETVLSGENIGKDRSKTTIAPAVTKTSTTQMLRSTDKSKIPPTTKFVRIVKRTNDLNVALALLKTGNDEATNSADKSVRRPTRRILKLVKLEPKNESGILERLSVSTEGIANSSGELKTFPNSSKVGTTWTLKCIKPNSNPVTMKKKPSTSIVDLTKDVEMPVVIGNNGKSSEVGLQPNANVQHSTSGEEPEIKRNVNVLLTKQSCYQCEMEPKIHRTCDPRRHRCLCCPIWLPNHEEFDRHVKDIHQQDSGTFAKPSP